MSIIQRLPQEALTKVLLHLNARDQAALAQTGTETKNSSNEASLSISQTYFSEVNQVILIASKCLNRMRKQCTQDPSPSLQRHIESAETSLKMLKTYSETHQDNAITPQQYRRYLHTLVARMVFHINRMDPKTPCLQDLNRKELCFMRRYIDKGAQAGRIFCPPAAQTTRSLATCLTLAKQGDVQGAITLALDIANQQEQIQVFLITCLDLAKRNQLPQVLEIFTRLTNHYQGKDPHPYFYNFFHEIWNVLYMNYLQEVGPHKTLDGVMQYLRIAFNYMHEDAIIWIIPRIAERDSLFTFLQQKAQLPFQSEEESQFITLCLQWLANEFTLNNQLHEALLTLSEINDETLIAAELMRLCNCHANDIESLILEKSFHPRLQGLALNVLIRRALTTGLHLKAEELAAKIIHASYASHAHFLLAEYYIDKHYTPERLQKATSHLDLILNDYEHRLMVTRLFDWATCHRDFDSAIVFASSCYEADDFVLLGLQSVHSRSHAFHLLIKRLTWLNGDNHFQRAAMLLKEISKQDVHQLAVHDLIQSLYRNLAHHAYNARHRQALDQILLIADADIRNELLVTFFTNSIYSLAENRTPRALFVEASNAITDPDTQQIMLTTLNAIPHSE